MGVSERSFPLVQGFRDLLWLPIEQYRKDGRLMRGLQRGAASFGSSTASAALELSNRLVQAIQVSGCPASGLCRTEQLEPSAPQLPGSVLKGLLRVGSLGMTALLYRETTMEMLSDLPGASKAGLPRPTGVPVQEWECPPGLQSPPCLLLMACLVKGGGGRLCLQTKNLRPRGCPGSFRPCTLLGQRDPREAREPVSWAVVR